ncbi:hypothetical protein [Sorangium sp. So ce887]|uniref:hypothetical protein n=1 Tax=Sorangium sp. So ce887 TaxID=3133324 RepID=UPI003F60AEDA
MAWLVAEHGALAAVAQKVAHLATTTDDVASIERALRRLRRRGNLDGGDWGRRLLYIFGLPRRVEEGLKWMGVYHSRFADLPLPLCLAQLRLWDRPPVSESRARVWIALGFASAALRRRDLGAAGAALGQARLARAASVAARVEMALLEAFLCSRRGEREQVRDRLEEAGRHLAEEGLSSEERACLHARWIDQRAFQLNHPPPGEAPDRGGALALYASISSEDVHPFVSYRRDAGLAYGRFRLGERAAAIALAESACRHAGDSGFVRLRAMALLLLARILGEDEGAAARGRALQIARRLEDEELLWRGERLAQR